MARLGIFSIKVFAGGANQGAVLLILLLLLF